MKYRTVSPKLVRFVVIVVSETGVTVSKSQKTIAQALELDGPKQFLVIDVRDLRTYHILDPTKFMEQWHENYNNPGWTFA